MQAAANRNRVLIAIGLGIAFLVTSFLPGKAPPADSKLPVKGTEADADSWYKLGVSALAMDDYDRAILSFSTASESYGELESSSWAELWRSIRIRRGRIDLPRAHSLIWEAFGYRAKFNKALTGRGDAYCKKGMLEEAVADYSEVIRLGQETETYRRRAAAYRALGEIAKAELDERQAEFQSTSNEREKR